VNTAVIQAAVLEEFGKPLVLAELQIDAPAPDEVLIRTAASGICHSDRTAQQGDNPRSPSPPVVLGHEAAGIVESVGVGVTSVRPGDKVVTCAAAACGACEWCQRGLQQHCEFPLRSRRAGEPPRLTRNGNPVAAFVGLGGFASHMLVHERAVVKIPDEMPLDRAALLGCAVHTGFGAVRRSAQVVLGDTVAVIGCGGVGLNVVQAARMAGAAQVIAVDLQSSKLDRAREFGATAVVDASAGDAVALVRDLTAGGVDHTFEVVGRPATIEQACAMTRTRGTITVIGLPRPGERVQIPGDTFFSEKRLQGSKMGSRFLLDIPWYCRMYLSGRLMLDELISQELSLSDVNRGLGALDSSDLARSVITF
jgi:S-(hydroxymethyl)glutathione dehydrogenase/alcohol dehydrogenase